MRLSVDSTELAGHVAWTAKALPRSAHTPALAGILAEAGADGQLALSAFDYTTSRHTTIPALDVAATGRILLPGRVLTEIVKALPKDRPVDVAADGRTATLRCGSLEYELPTLAACDYPALPVLPSKAGSVDAAALAAAADRAAEAASRDDAVPMLTCVCVDADDDRLHLAATDRYRLSWDNVPWRPGEGTPPARWMVDAALLREAARAMLAGDVHVHASENMLALACDGRYVTIRLAGEEFIDYKPRFPETAPVTASFDAAGLAAAVRRVMLAADQSMPVQLHFAGDTVTVRAGGGDTGRGQEVMPAGLDGAETFNVAFKAAYLLGGLTRILGRATLALEAPAKPAVLAPAGDEGGQPWRYLVMPVRLAG